MEVSHMKSLWILINSLGIKSALKNRLYLGAFIMVNAMVGSIAWLLIGRLLYPKVEWLICFVGYPAIFIGFFGGLIYLFNHKFT